MSASPLHGVTHACFGLSYLLAFGFEAVRWSAPGPRWLRPAGLAVGGAGFFAHTAYLAYHHPSPAEPAAALLLLAWVLAVFYLYGTVHHARQAWAVFVLPVVIGLVGLSFAVAAAEPGTDVGVPGWLTADRTWGVIHGVLLLLAAVGVGVAALASVMYLVQAHRLKAKANPLGGIKLLSLERLEEMRRRGVTAAFPLLTAGLILGGVLLRQEHDLSTNWLNVKVLGTVGLWVVFAVLLYLRYAARAPGRRLALGTVCAFGLFVAVLAAHHPFVEGGR
jgi:ABC-type transport system involved in cytochrome c biogenesis permease subunit